MHLLMVGLYEITAALALLIEAPCALEVIAVEIKEAHDG